MRTYDIYTQKNVHLHLIYINQKLTKYMKKRAPNVCRYKQNKKSCDLYRNIFVLWRRQRDLNPRASFPTYTLSRGASSASWVCLQLAMTTNKSIKMVSPHGLEPWTLWLRVRCSANWAKERSIGSVF